MTYMSRPPDDAPEQPEQLAPASGPTGAKVEAPNRPPNSRSKGTAGLGTFLAQAKAAQRMIDGVGLGSPVMRAMADAARAKADFERNLPIVQVAEAARRHAQEMQRLRVAIEGPTAIFRDIDAALRNAPRTESLRVPKYMRDFQLWADRIAEQQRAVMKIASPSLGAAILQGTLAAGRHSVGNGIARQMAEQLAAVRIGIEQSMALRMADIGRAFTIGAAPIGSAVLASLPSATLGGNWAWATTGIAAKAGLAALEIEDNGDALALVVTEAVGGTLAVDGVPLTVNGDVDAGTLAALAVAIWERAARMVPGLSDDAKWSLICLIMSILVTLHDQVDSKERDGAMLQAVREQTAAVRDLAVHLRSDVSTQSDQWRVMKARPLRDNPEATASRIGTIPAGALVDELRRMDRWLYVRIADGPMAGSEGWVFMREMRPSSHE